MGRNEGLEASWKLGTVRSQRPNKQKSDAPPGVALQRWGPPLALSALFGALHKSLNGGEDGVDRGDVDNTAVARREGRRVWEG